MNAPSGPPALLVVGDVMLDVVAAPVGPIALGADTPSTITLVPGGSGANQAAWLGHMGNLVSFAGRAGSDSHEWHVAALRQHGVEPLVAKDDVLRSGILVNLISSDGERSFLTDRGANVGLSRDDLPDAVLDRVGLVHVSGYALFGAQSRAAVLDFLALAKSRGIPVSIDPGSASFLSDVGPAAFLQWTSGAQVCFPNAAEAATLASSNDRSVQLRVLRAHYDTVVITCGAVGAIAASAREVEPIVVDAPDVPALDTTGAGDAFVAGFLSAYVRAQNLAECLRAGVAAGSAAVSAYGGRPPLTQCLASSERFV
jgi:sugar/nucleoside kinase (ribokinase family)